MRKYKAVVFDLDDTLGHFEEIAIFLTGLKKGLGNDIVDDNFSYKGVFYTYENFCIRSKSLNFF